MVKAGSSIPDIANAYPKSFIMYGRGIRDLQSVLSLKGREHRTYGYWCYGATGTGKSRWAHGLTASSTYVKDPFSKWWDGYVQQETVVVDDYRPNKELSFSDLLRLADYYAMSVQTKGGSVQFNSKRIIITCPHPIVQSFAHLTFMEEGSIAQLERRFVQLEFGPDKLSHLVTVEQYEVDHVVPLEEITNIVPV